MKHSLLFAALCFAATLSAATVNYTADDATIFPNPERGIITEFDHVVTLSEPYCVKGREDYLKTYFVDKDQTTLILVLYYLDNYKNTATLPDEILSAFDEDMKVLRSMGLKAILRFAYTADASGDIGYDAPLDIVKSHISQYESHWKANADVMFCFQAGFVGTWGEWFYTNHFGNWESQMNDNRRAVVDALLEAVPADRCIQLRTPLFKTTYFQPQDTKPLTEAEAHKNTPKARLAHHNDAFLVDESNLGTYVDPETDKAYISQETFFVPIGGETCILDDYTAETNASYAKTTAEMSYLHWTFIQGGYSQVVTEKWRKNGTFDEINRRLGYRYQLVSGTFSDEVAQGGKLTVNMKIRNAGYAPLYNERHAYIVLRSSTKTISLPLQSDPRSWKPNNVVTTINEQLDIPADLPTGSYQLFLHLPDAYASIADDARYAVRFANTDIWDEATGMNSLNASVTVKPAGTPTPPDPPTPQTDPILPATLNKANVNAYSSDMTWYNSDYFNFGPDDAPNTDRWAEWEVQLNNPGKFIVSEEMASVPNPWKEGTLLGHAWQLQLFDDGALFGEYTTDDSWDEGYLTYETPWDLSAVPAGTYTLHVQNVMEWGQPKLKSLTLTFDGEIPTAIDNTNDQMRKCENAKMIHDGNMFIRHNGRLYDLNGQMIK